MLLFMDRGWYCTIREHQTYPHGHLCARVFNEHGEETTRPLIAARVDCTPEELFQEVIQWAAA